MSKLPRKILTTALVLTGSALLLSACSNGSSAGTIAKTSVNTSGLTLEVIPKPIPEPEFKYSLGDESPPTTELPPFYDVTLPENAITSVGTEQPPTYELPEFTFDKTLSTISFPQLSTPVSSNDSPVAKAPSLIVNPQNVNSTLTFAKPEEKRSTTEVKDRTYEHIYVNADATYGGTVIQSTKGALSVFQIRPAVTQGLTAPDTEHKSQQESYKQLTTSADVKTSNIPDVLDNAAIGDLYTKATTEDSKILVVGHDMTTNTNLGASITKEYLSKNPNHTDGEQNDMLPADRPQVSTTEAALYAIAGKTDKSKVPSLLSLENTIKLLAPQQDKILEDVDIGKVFGSTAFKNSFSDVGKDKPNTFPTVLLAWSPIGYDQNHYKAIVNENVPKDVDPNYSFDTRLAAYSGSLIDTLNEVGILKQEAHKFGLPALNSVAKTKDVLIIAPTGDNGENSHNPYALSLYADDQDYSALRNKTILVTAHKLGTANSTPCHDYSKYYCLTAYGEVTAEYTKEAQAKTKNETYSGTSSINAAAYVAATAGLVQSTFPFFTPENVKDTLLTTAKDLGIIGVDATYGWGIVQPQDAVQGPKQILNGQFVVDTSRNLAAQYQRKSEQQTPFLKFYFNNAISGTGDLVFKGSDYSPSHIYLTAENTYTGNTYLQNSARVVLNGSIASSNTLVTNKSELYGTGTLQNLYNDGGTVHSYDFDFPTNVNLLQSRLVFNRSPHPQNPQITITIYLQAYYFNATGTDKPLLTVNGNYTQTATGKLDTKLGSPLYVKGSTSLAGELEVSGIKNFYTDANGNAYGDVLVSTSPFTNGFDKVTITSPYLAETAEVQKDLDTQNNLWYLSVKTKFLTTPRTIAYPSLASSEHNLLLAGNDNIQSLGLSTYNNYLSLTADENPSVDTSPKNNQAQPTSALSNLYSSIIGESTIDNINGTLKAFAGTEFTETVEHNHMLHQAALNKATSQLFTFDSNGATNATVSTDYLAASNGATSYLTAVNANYQLGQHKLALGVNQGGSSWKHSQATEKNQHTTFGGTLGYATQLNKDFGVNAYAGYQYSSNDLVRNLNILDTAYNHNDKLVVDETVLGANFFYNVPVPAQFQVFLGANQHWSKTGAVTEQYGKDTQAYRLELGKNTVNYTNLVVGAQFTQANLLGAYGWNGLDLNASYSLAYSVNNWNELSAQLADNMLTVKQTYARSNPSKLTHQAALSLTQKLDDTFSVGAKASLLSAKETYKSLGLHLNARF